MQRWGRTFRILDLQSLKTKVANLQILAFLRYASRFRDVKNDFQIMPLWAG